MEDSNISKYKDRIKDISKAVYQEVKSQKQALNNFDGQ